MIEDRKKSLKELIKNHSKKSNKILIYYLLERMEIIENIIETLLLCEVDQDIEDKILPDLNMEINKIKEDIKFISNYKR